MFCSTIAYHERFEAEKFHVFTWLQNFLYESSRWRCSNMDYVGLHESFFASVQHSMKLSCLKTFMVYGIIVWLTQLLILISSSAY